MSKDEISVEEYRKLVKSCSVSKKGRLIVDSTDMLSEFREAFIAPILNPKENKKISNATKCEYEGIQFDSKLEMSMYIALKNAKIPFTFKHTLELIPSFIWHTHKIRSVTWSPDFIFNDIQIVLDTKGYFNDIAPIKIKLCKYMFYLLGDMRWNIWIVKNKSEIPACIELLKMYISGDFIQPNYKQLIKKFEV